MYIKKVEKLPQKQLFEELRSVPLLKNPDILPYKNAKFEIKSARPTDFHPSAFYLLRFELSFLALLMDSLAEKMGGWKKLNSLLEYTDEFGATWRMIPPVVEFADFGEWMILDGEHRSYIALSRNIEIPMLFISNVSVPYPCLPLPEKWKSVKITDKAPVLKRLFRPGLNDAPETQRALRRDFAKFGSMGERKVL